MLQFGQLLTEMQEQFKNQQDQMKEEQNQKMEEQNQKMEEQNQKIKKENNQKITELNLKIDSQNQKLEEINRILQQNINRNNLPNNSNNLLNNPNENILENIENGIKLLKEKSDKFEEELKHTDLNIYLLQNYTKQIELNDNKNYEILNLKYEYISNIYKLLLIRKISNQILENLFEGEKKNNYLKTEHKFEDSNNQQFPIIIAKNDISKVPKMKINQILDFLMFLKEKCSKIIHFSDKSSLLQFDLLTEILGGNITKSNQIEKSYLNATQALSLLFDDLKVFEQNIQIINVPNEDKEKKLLTQIKEELNKKKQNC